jgi:hypothetical protein
LTAADQPRAPREVYRAIVDEYDPDLPPGPPVPGQPGEAYQHPSTESFTQAAHRVDGARTVLVDGTERTTEGLSISARIRRKVVHRGHRRTRLDVVDRLQRGPSLSLVGLTAHADRRRSRLLLLRPSRVKDKKPLKGPYWADTWSNRLEKAARALSRRNTSGR